MILGFKEKKRFPPLLFNNDLLSAREGPVVGYNSEQNSPTFEEFKF